MADIYYKFPIKASVEELFRLVSTPEGLNIWWSLKSKGTPEKDEIMELNFGPGYDWKLRISSFEPNKKIEYETNSQLYNCRYHLRFGWKD